MLINPFVYNYIIVLVCFLTKYHLPYANISDGYYFLTIDLKQQWTHQNIFDLQIIVRIIFPGIVQELGLIEHWFIMHHVSSISI